MMWGIRTGKNGEKIHTLQNVVGSYLKACPVFNNHVCINSITRQDKTLLLVGIDLL